MTHKKVNSEWVRLMKKVRLFWLGHRSPENMARLSPYDLAHSFSLGSPLMCWLSSNVFIEFKLTSGSPRSSRPGTESCINTWRFLNLKAKTLQGSSNKPWRSVPGKKKKKTQQFLLSAEWRERMKVKKKEREERWRETKRRYERGREGAKKWRGV